MTYAELNRLANRFAHVLLDQGVSPGSRVGLCIPRSPALIVAVLGVLKAGGAYVPLEPSMPAERIAMIARQARLASLWVDEADVSRLSAMCQQVAAFKLSDKRFAEAMETNPALRATGEAAAYVIYTSGSTGVPKEAAVYHRSLANLIDWYVAEFDIDAGDRALLMTSISFDLTQKNLYGVLSVGGQLHLAPPGPYDPDVLRANLGVNRITMVNCTLSAFYPLVSVGRRKGTQPARFAASGDLGRRTDPYGAFGAVVPSSGLARGNCQQLWPDRMHRYYDLLPC